MLLEKTKIYGVNNVGASNPALIERTDAAVGLSFSVGPSKIQSDFDRCYPYCDMEEVTDEHGNVFIKIPKFYAKITKNADGTYKHQISGVRYDGFSTLFLDGKGNELDYILVGKYEASGAKAKAESKSGKTVLVNITLPEMRTACRANGEGYQQYDFLIDLIIKELFLIEFATTNSQAIMYGYARSNSAAVQTGRTDGVNTPSGSEISNTDGKHAMKYRGIENLWGNTWTFVDGISFDAEKVYVCFDPTAYVSEDYSAPYIYQGDRVVDDGGYVSKIEPLGNHPLIQYVTEINGSSTTYYSDYYWTDGTILCVGGYWSSGDGAGLWAWHGGDDASNYYSPIGGRLCYKPL